MKKDVVPVEIRGILPANSGCAIFVGNDEKVFVIQVEHNMGAIIGMFLRETPKERPLTHDLIANIFNGFNITVERVVITELKNSTYISQFSETLASQQNPDGSWLTGPAKPTGVFPNTESTILAIVALKLAWNL